ncbi:hypothetical protein [uncultured Desulfosarcina sp.]|uniref:EF-hand domain-containing protein n=1 Tax=uncultured Desulfosarcina sp. TaxID=218289 RepID=UPI0029C87814|nr:hypothetical protein [uncultured Desulfosarcina sp.]
MNDKRIRYLLKTAAITAAICFNPMAVWAQDNEIGADESPFIQHFDQDGDGLVAVDEFPGDDFQFSRLDINGDGYLDAAEAPQDPPHGGPDPKEMISNFDADGDGQLSASEFAGPLDHFDHLDDDGDGLLSIQELLAGRPRPPEGSGFFNDDTDQDGAVSQAEFSGPTELFDRLDADHNGYITREESMPKHRTGRSDGYTETEFEPQ